MEATETQNEASEHKVEQPQQAELSTQKQPDQRLPAQLDARESGVLIGSSLEQEYRLARAYSASGLMPKGLNTPEKVLVAIQLCRELGLPPMSSVSKIMVLNGSAAIFGDLPLALVMRSGKMLAFKETWQKDDKGNVVGATCYTKRKDIEIETTREFTLEDAKTAGLFGNNVWQKYPARMLQFRARSWALKDTYPDVLGGCLLGEYDLNAMEVNGRIEGSTRRNSADTFNREYADTDAETPQ